MDPKASEAALASSPPIGAAEPSPEERYEEGFEGSTVVGSKGVSRAREVEGPEEVMKGEEVVRDEERA